MGYLFKNNFHEFLNLCGDAGAARLEAEKWAANPDECWHWMSYRAERLDRAEQLRVRANREDGCNLPPVEY